VHFRLTDFFFAIANECATLHCLSYKKAGIEILTRN
jgi:hypothetical protein